jgi:predicted  nucleic acid-binding Zn-ribbon protein
MDDLQSELTNAQEITDTIHKSLVVFDASEEDLTQELDDLFIEEESHEMEKDLSKAMPKVDTEPPSIRSRIIPLQSQLAEEEGT